MSNIYFNEKQHSYTTEAGLPFISATQLKAKYVKKFSDKAYDIAKACEKIGRNPRHEKYFKYRNKTAKQILAEWDNESEIGRINGNEKHDYLEDTIKSSTNFYSIFKSRYSNNKSDLIKLYTVNDVLNNIDNGISFGRLDVDYFEKVGIKIKYPEIYDIIVEFANQGWTIYSEVCGYNLEYMVSGLIDLLLVKDNRFAILDWKTGKAPIRFESGYWEKDNNGIISNYKFTDDTMKYPINHLPQSTGIEYTIQLSIYTKFVEDLGLEHFVSVIFQILPDIYTAQDCKGRGDLIGKPKILVIPVNYLKLEVESMFAHYHKNKQLAITI